MDSNAETDSDADVQLETVQPSQSALAAAGTFPGAAPRTRSAGTTGTRCGGTTRTRSAVTAGPRRRGTARCSPRVTTRTRTRTRTNVGIRRPRGGGRRRARRPRSHSTVIIDHGVFEHAAIQAPIIDLDFILRNSVWLYFAFAAVTDAWLRREFYQLAMAAGVSGAVKLAHVEFDGAGLVLPWTVVNDTATCDGGFGASLPASGSAYWFWMGGCRRSREQRRESGSRDEREENEMTPGQQAGCCLLPPGC